MTRREKEYERLPGRGMRRGSILRSSRLWLGKDHMLLVDSDGFVETYKRFSFCDIQAITLTRTTRRAVLNTIFLFLAVFFGLFLLSDNDVVRTVFTGLVALFVLLAIINSLRGPACRCELTTAVQTDELASLSRVSRANRVLSQLRPLIDAAQSKAAWRAESAPKVPATKLNTEGIKKAPPSLP